MSRYVIATNGETHHPSLEDLRAAERNHAELASYVGGEADERMVVVAGRKPSGSTVWTLYTQARDAWIRSAEARNPREQRQRNREAREAEAKVLDACKAIGPADDVGGGQR